MDTRPDAENADLPVRPSPFAPVTDIRPKRIQALNSRVLWFMPDCDAEVEWLLRLAVFSLLLAGGLLVHPAIAALALTCVFLPGVLYILADLSGLITIGETYSRKQARHVAEVRAQREQSYEDKVAAYEAVHGPGSLERAKSSAAAVRQEKLAVMAHAAKRKRLMALPS